MSTDSRCANDKCSNLSIPEGEGYCSQCMKALDDIEESHKKPLLDSDSLLQEELARFSTLHCNTCDRDIEDEASMKAFDNENACCFQCKNYREEDEVNNNDNNNDNNNNVNDNDNDNDNVDDDNNNNNGDIDMSVRLCEYEGCHNTSVSVEFHHSIPYCAPCCDRLDIALDSVSDFTKKKSPQVRIYCNRIIIVHNTYSDEASYGIKGVIQLYSSNYWRITYGDEQGLYGYNEVSAEVKLSKPQYSMYIGCAMVGTGPWEGKVDILVICSIWRTVCPDPYHVYVYYNFTNEQIIKMPKEKFIAQIKDKYAMARGFSFDATKVFGAYYKFVFDTKQYYDGLAHRHLRNPVVGKLLLAEADKRAEERYSKREASARQREAKKAKEAAEKKEKAEEEKRAAKEAVNQKKVEQKLKSTKRPKALIPQTVVDIDDSSCEEVHKDSPIKKKYNLTNNYYRNISAATENNNYVPQGRVASYSTNLSESPSFTAEAMKALEEKLSSKFEKQIENVNKQTLGEIMQLKSLLLQQTSLREAANSNFPTPNSSLDTSNLSLLANSRNVNTSMEKAKLMNSAIAYQTLNATANYQLQLLSNFFN